MIVNQLHVLLTVSLVTSEHLVASWFYVPGYIKNWRTTIGLNSEERWSFATSFLLQPFHQLTNKEFLHANNLRIAYNAALLSRRFLNCDVLQHIFRQHPAWLNIHLLQDHPKLGVDLLGLL